MKSKTNLFLHHRKIEKHGSKLLIWPNWLTRDLLCTLTIQRIHHTSFCLSGHFYPTQLLHSHAHSLHTEQNSRKRDTFRDWGFGASTSQYHSQGKRIMFICRTSFDPHNKLRCNKCGWENRSPGVGLVFILLFWLYYSLVRFWRKWNE